MNRGNILLSKSHGQNFEKKRGDAVVRGSGGGRGKLHPLLPWLKLMSNFTAMISNVVVMNFKQATTAKPKTKS